MEQIESARWPIIRESSLSEGLCRQLRGAILNGVFRPGQMLRQEVIASRLGVSRGPLREVLSRLEGEGIITLYPRRGYAVTSLDPKEIEELFDLRVLLETKLARISALKRGSSDIDLVRRLNLELGQVVESGLLDGRNMFHWFDLNMEFHDALLAPAGLKRHFKMLQTLRLQVEPYIRLETYLTGGLSQAQSEHDALVAAFVNGDTECFTQLIGQHIRHTQERLLQGLMQKDSFAEAFSTTVTEP